LGRKGREIIRAKVDDVIADLTKAYADEWLAHYQYWLAARWIRSLDGDTLRDILIEQSNDELGHAEKIANRIIQLGGTPIMDPGKLLQTSGCGYKQPPSDPNNLKQVIQDVLDAEACAIETYNKLAEKYRTTDLVTHEMFEDLLEDEVDDEEQWEKLAEIWKK
jgi:bacterioferritin